MTIQRYIISLGGHAFQRLLEPGEDVVPVGPILLQVLCAQVEARAKNGVY